MRDHALISAVVGTSHFGALDVTSCLTSGVSFRRTLTLCARRLPVLSMHICQFPDTSLFDSEIERIPGGSSCQFFDGPSGIAVADVQGAPGRSGEHG